jgi:hypothetical protein
LSEASDSRARVEDTQALAGLDQFQLVKQTRTRPDQTHLAFEHIPKLRKLIEFGSSQEFPQSRYGGSICQVRGHMLGLRPHGAEFHQGERLFIPTDARLSEHWRAGVE